VTYTFFVTGEKTKDFKNTSSFRQGTVCHLLFLECLMRVNMENPRPKHLLFEVSCLNYGTFYI